MDEGSISIADQQQAEERLQSALVRSEEANLDLQNAYISLRRLTGMDISTGTLPPDLSAAMPSDLPTASGDPRQATFGEGRWHVHSGGWAPDGSGFVYSRDLDRGDIYVIEPANAESE